MRCTLIALAALFIIAVPARVATATTPATRANVIVILCDDLGAGDLGVTGHPHVRTPHLDRLAAEGIRLTNCYAAAPVCSPSRAGLLTGRTPNRVGIFDWIPHGSNLALSSDETTIATLLRDAGYQTFLAGKWHLNGRLDDDVHPTPRDHGFDHWLATSNNARPSHHNPRNFRRNGVPLGEVDGYACQIVTDEALRWLREDRDPRKPFFQLIAFHEPHERIASPPALVASYRAVARNEREAEYFANVTNVDAAVGRLMDALAALGLDESTLIFFTSDNGPETLDRYRGAERSYGSTGGLRGMKLHLHEGGIRVPGLLRWKGTIAPGQVITVPVSGVDVLPTLTEVASVAVPDDRVLDGASLAPLWEGRDLVRSRPLFWTYFRSLGGAHAVLREGPWKVVAGWNGAGGPARGRIDAEARRTIRGGTLTSFELYDLDRDPGETTNVAAQHPERLARMTDQITATYDDVKREASHAHLADGDRPHILFLLSDDQQWNAIRAMGNEVVETPNLDTLVRNGVTFPRTYCMGSWSGAVCLPSRAMMLSGQSLWQVDGSLATTPILPAILAANGYTTFGCGKWHNGKTSFARGFTRGGHVFFGGMSDHDRVPVFPFDPEGRYPAETRTISTTFSSELFANDVIGFLDTYRDDKPFFAYVAFTAPHDPRMAPAPYANMYDADRIPLPPNFLPEHPFDNGELRIRDEMLATFPRTPDEVRTHLAAYYAMISHMDAQIGRILVALERNGHAERTIVVFASDHGLAVGQHGLMGKQNMYEHSVRAPLTIAGRGIPRGARAAALVYLYDIAPTILDLAGIQAPRTMAGTSLAGFWQGDPPAVRDAVYAAYQQKQRMVRTDRWKLIRYTVEGKVTWQLFDLDRDPWETTNLAGDPVHAAILADLRATLREQMLAFDDPAE